MIRHRHSSIKEGPLPVTASQEVFYRPSQEKAPELSGLPRVKLPKGGGKEQIGIDQDINADVFHSPVRSDTLASGVKRQTEKEDMEKLGANIAEDTPVSEVRMGR